MVDLGVGSCELAEPLWKALVQSQGQGPGNGAPFPGRNLGGFANPISLTCFLRDPLAHLIFCRWPLRGDGDKYTLRSGNQQPTTISNYLSCGRVSCVSSPERFHSYHRTPMRFTITISVQPRTLWGCFFNSSLRNGLWIHTWWYTSSSMRFNRIQVHHHPSSNQLRQTNCFFLKFIGSSPTSWGNWEAYHPTRPLVAGLREEIYIKPPVWYLQICLCL